MDTTKSAHIIAEILHIESTVIPVLKKMLAQQHRRVEELQAELTRLNGPAASAPNRPQAPGHNQTAA